MYFICIRYYVELKREQMNFLSNFFGTEPKVDFKALVASGATILDVRTPDEYATGCIKGSVNIALNVLPQKYELLNKQNPIIVYCASGMRSASAKALLVQYGFNEVYDGGGMHRLRSNLDV
jgi:phage shock protein E